MAVTSQRQNTGKRDKKVPAKSDKSNKIKEQNRDRRGTVMDYQDSCEMTTATKVLAMPTTDVPLFLRQCVSERSLSWVVGELNKALLFGNSEEREEAGKALTHLGFI